MASQTSNSPTSPSTQVLGKFFVEQYYHILHHSPELVYKFYHDSSVLSRPDNNGQMTSVTTMQGINEKILSLDYKNYKAEIQTADALNSYKEGVTVLVTGCLMGKDKLKRKFAQSFFLAPKNNGYFVLNDVFRYLEDSELLENYRVNDIENVPKASLTSTPAEGLAHVRDPPAPDPSTFVVEEDQNAAEKAHEPSDREIQISNEKDAVEESQSHLNGSEISIVAESASSTAQEDASEISYASRKCYASIVKVTKQHRRPTKVYVSTNTAKVTPKKIENQSIASALSAPPETLAPSSIDVPENDYNHDHDEEVEGYSIYIRNLPFNITPTQLELEFKSEEIHPRDSSPSSSFDSNLHEEKPASLSSVKAKIYRLLGREKLLHQVLGGGKSADVLLWRNKKISAGVLGAVTAVWVLFELVEYHLLTLVCHILMLAIALMFLWSNSHTFIKKTRPYIPEVHIPEEPFLQAASALRMEMNYAFSVLHDIASGRDLKKFLSVIAGLWILSIVGSSCNFLTLFYIAFVLLHTVPVIYEKYEDKVDPFAEKAVIELKKQYAVFDAKVLSKIPKVPLKAKKV
ncbi:hypothetical protein SLE2022_180390 [Rubroshorea leprosula]